MLTRIWQDTHGNTNLISYFTTGVVLPVLLAGMLVPRPALAFEAMLMSPMITTLMAFNPTATPDSESVPMLAEPVHPRIGAVIAQGSPVTNTSVAPVARVIQPKAAALRVLNAPLVMEGEASYYSRAGCLGCNPLRIMANGQPLNDAALTMAIGADKKHLVGYQARVTSLATGKSVMVRITDTGGFYKDKYGNRVADLTIATKEAIGMRGGVGQVRVEVY